MHSIATQFREIVNALRATIGAHLAHDRRAEPVFALLWHHLGRTIQRIHALYTRWQAGTLPKPRKPRPGRPRAPRPEQLRLPRARSWVVAHVGYHAAAQAGYLQQLLATPDMQDFLHAVPQAARLLRPLCHILGIDPPTPPRMACVDGTALAKRSRAPRSKSRTKARPRHPHRILLPPPIPAPLIPPPIWRFG